MNLKEMESRLLKVHHEDFLKWFGPFFLFFYFCKRIKLSLHSIKNYLLYFHFSNRFMCYNFNIF